MSAATSTGQDLSEFYVEFAEDAPTEFCYFGMGSRIGASPSHFGSWLQAAHALEPYVISHNLTSFQSLSESSSEDIDTFVIAIVRQATSSDVLLDRVSRAMEAASPTRTLLFSPVLQHGRQDVMHRESPGSPGAAKESQEPRAVRVVRELCEWLELTEAELADVVGFSVRSIANWRRGRKPYPATVRRLYQVHALIESLVGRLGVGFVRLWLSPQVDGSSRLDLLHHDDDGLSRLLEEASDLLYTRPEREQRAAAESEERAIEDEFDIAPRPEVMKSSLRSRKR